ncbi:MAG TPA: 30S ribosomal protein S17 [Candidatus Bathyarchaeia archaeon]|nr:30S ribosomal protein S17 [Candidatus Bathyarchaeia archaeon]
MKTLIGKVVSAKTEKTATVLIEHKRRHPVYKKVVKRSKKYPVHNDLGAKEGDKVTIIQTRPLSKTKKWRVIEIK